MNENHSEMYSANSGYYDLPVKEPWVCGKTLYSVITIGSAILIGIAASCFFAPRLFGNVTLTATGITLIGAYYAIFTMFAPFILFYSCIHGCSKFNRKLFDDRENNRFKATDILYAIQAICVAFLKTVLIYYLIAIFSSPVVLIIIVLVAANSVFKIFRW